MKYTVITGASSGIGYEAAKVFAKRGNNLIITARRVENLDRLKQEILLIRPDVDIKIIQADLSVNDEVYKFYEHLKNYEIETFVNNAGLGNYGDVANQPLHKIETMLRLNVEAVVILSTLFVRDYRDVHNTQLINISSAGGYTIVPNAITYCASKFFVSSFTEGLARELRESGAKMKAKVLAPAATETEFAMRAHNVESYDYVEGFGKFHSAAQIAEFMMNLYDNDFIVGLVDRDTFSFKLCEPLFRYAGSN